MNKYQIFTLKSIRKVYTTLFNKKKTYNPECIQDADIASNIIYDTLMADEPCMIARFGSTELTCLINYIGVHQEKKQYLNYIKGKSNPWWWEPKIINQMQNWSGFFPPTVDKIEQFCKLLLDDIPQVDVLGSWMSSENIFKTELENSKKIWLDFLNPFFARNPWSKALEGKKILVVHPFVETIKKQYIQRKLLFKNPNMLPEFELKTIKAIQSIGNETVQFDDWFEALQFMQDEIDKMDYDICLIGAGAYGFPLASHVKRKGKKAIHLGGSLQLLFGIRGKRWEDPNLNKEYSFANLMNQHWVRPSKEETPKNSNNIEGACYW